MNDWEFVDLARPHVNITLTRCARGRSSALAAFLALHLTRYLESCTAGYEWHQESRLPFQVLARWFAHITVAPMVVHRQVRRAPVKYWVCEVLGMAVPTLQCFLSGFGRAVESKGRPFYEPPGLPKLASFMRPRLRLDGRDSAHCGEVEDRL